MELYSHRNIVAMHVSATQLINKSSPQSLLHHQKLHPNDKKIWDAAYVEEYNGLLELNAFEYISEK